MTANVNISPEKMTEFSDFITEEIGLYFPKEKWYDLEKGLKEITKIFQYEDVETCVNSLMSSSLSQKQIEIVASVLTIGETYFFRDPNTFRVLEEHILRPLINERRQKNKTLRIWSAGCASGEEAYTIAIILCRLLQDIKKWNITLLSTDINTNFLKKLATGIYSEWSFRGVPKEIKNNYFNKIATGKYQIHPRIKKLITPFYLNLAKDNYPSLLNSTNAMDVIFCRNVLMYFSPALINQVSKKLFNCLVEGGCLIVSSSEVTSYYFSLFKSECINQVTIYSKEKIPKAPCHEKENTAVNMQKIEKPIKVEPSFLEQQIKKIDYKKLGLEYANNGQLQEALNCIDKAVIDNKLDLELLYLRSLIYLELNQIEDAVFALNRVIYLDKNFIPAYIAMGNILLKQHKINQADKYFEYALSVLNEMDPDRLQGDMTVKRLIEIIQSLREIEEKI